MPLEFKVPLINRKYACISDYNEVILSAIVSTYLYEPSHYTVFFEFPSVGDYKREVPVENFTEENYISDTRAREANIRIHNVLRLIGTSETLILIGLNNEQMSYLDFLDDYNVISINSYPDLNELESLTEDKEVLKCCESDILLGLNTALISNKRLSICDQSEPVIPPLNSGNHGVIVAERGDKLVDVIATNYALSTGCDIEVIDKPSENKSFIKEKIRDWRESNNSTQLFRDLGALIYPCIEHIDFTQYVFATFFTNGIPYSLIMDNVIPCSYVHSLLKPDLFILNNILIEERGYIQSSIVFSPQNFEHEETNYVIKELKNNNHHVISLIGDEATVYNVDNYIKEYPYDVLHLCSHGGEVEGFHMEVTFYDRDGEKHVVEYDDVISFAPSLDEEKIAVTSKHIFRKLDGLIWKSKELENKNYPHYVFQDMLSHIDLLKKHKSTGKSVIPDSCAIVCKDFNYQGLFNTISGEHTSPFIFNNTCWSYDGISDSFLKNGARGYIGTLWNVNNDTAVETACSFYENVFDHTILEAFYSSLPKKEADEYEKNVYVFWGVHFSRLFAKNTYQETRQKIANKLFIGFSRRKEQNQTMSSGYGKEEVSRLAKWNISTLKRNFAKEGFCLLLSLAIKKVNQVF